MKTASFRLEAPAKINVTLEVIGKLPNGYHAIRSVFVRLDKLSDAIELDIEEGETGVSVSCTSADVPTSASNSCHRAAVAYLAAVHEAARIHVHIAKNIPVAAGLGGGSSDAAAVLLALNRHFCARLSPKKLEAVGSTVGKDVPFFIRGASVCHVSGMGEQIRPLKAIPRLHVLVVHPRIAVSTADAYRAVAANLSYMSNPERADVSAAMASAMTARDVEAIAALLFNDFEASVERAHPVIKEIKQALRAFGARGALMSGSGSTVFGLFRSAGALRRAERNLRTHYPRFFVAGA